MKIRDETLFRAMERAYFVEYLPLLTVFVLRAPLTSWLLFKMNDNDGRSPCSVNEDYSRSRLLTGINSTQRRAFAYFWLIAALILIQFYTLFFHRLWYLPHLGMDFHLTTSHVVCLKNWSGFMALIFDRSYCWARSLRIAMLRRCSNDMAKQLNLAHPTPTHAGRGGCASLG